jgi:alkylated DNA repair dioxygenase AlkB
MTEQGLDGFEYILDFVSPEEESSLSDRLSGLTYRPAKMHGQTSRREMHYYGYEYVAQRRALIQLPEPMPPWLISLRARCAAAAGSDAEAFDQVIITRYGEGAAISAHTDHATLFGPTVIGVSLLSAVDMVFHAPGGGRISHILGPRSLYVLRGEARYAWKHATGRVTAPPRYSVTFRSVTRLAVRASMVPWRP